MPRRDGHVYVQFHLKRLETRKDSFNLQFEKRISLSLPYLKFVYSK